MVKKDQQSLKTGTPQETKLKDAQIETTKKVNAVSMKETLNELVNELVEGSRSHQIPIQENGTKSLAKVSNTRDEVPQSSNRCNLM
mmetsp:Transcript_11156/g.18020  ORF Transcript_11156/g.18020 Transcript_11156/m.18020 type:complete len:86 (-) Transcript_11156:121-378(-)